MRRIQKMARVCQRLLPLSWAGWCLALTAAVAGMWSRTHGRDEVANALGFCLGALVLLLILCNYLAQFLASRAGSGPALLQVRLPPSLWQVPDSGAAPGSAAGSESGFDTDSASHSGPAADPATRIQPPAPAEALSGWSGGAPLLLRLGLVTMATLWKKADGPGQVVMRGRLGADGREHIAVGRRGTFEFRRQLVLKDVFNLTCARLEKSEVARISISPPETGRLARLPPAFPDSDEGWSQYGKRQGDYFDILTADPQTPRRLLLWKLSLKSGSTTAKYRRAPEPVAQHRRRLGVFFQITPMDEPAAAFLCSSLAAPSGTTDMFGTDWLFADSLDPGKLQPGQGAGARIVTRRLVQSGSREIIPSSLSAEPLAAFVLKCRQQGISEVWVFHGPDWLPGGPWAESAGARGTAPQRPAPGTVPSAVAGVAAAFFRVVPGTVKGVSLRALPRQPTHFEITVS